MDERDKIVLKLKINKKKHNKFYILLCVVLGLKLIAEYTEMLSIIPYITHILNVVLLMAVAGLVYTLRQEKLNTERYKDSSGSKDISHLPRI